MFKKIRFRIYGALLNWHYSRGMVYNKIAEEYSIDAEKHLNKASKYVEKLAIIGAREEGS